VVNGGEFCDDGDTDNTDACRNDCTACGDGIVNGNEECDDGNTNNLDNCRNDCTLPLCGDDITDSGETCDGADDATCNTDCRPAGGDAECTCCGDGVVNGGEYCDDGDSDNTDACRNDCTACGDGIVNGNEECDDGNSDNADDCRNNCRLPICGDNIADAGETCDGTDDDTCNSACRAPGGADECTCCGDGVIQTGEQCDDGNGTSGDGCSAACEVEADFAGCTPGFWKQPHHLQYWCDAFSPDDRIDDVFGVDSTSNPTLLKALSTGGGGEIAFLRHAVAALLNSCHDEVTYFYSTAEVIELVQEAYDSGDFGLAHGLFEEQNELGCTVDKSNPVRGSSRGQSQLNKDDR